MRLRILPAAYSATEIREYGRQLVADNPTWATHGFTVLGTSPRPEGAIVSVTGDLAAAGLMLGRDQRTLVVLPAESGPTSS